MDCHWSLENALRNFACLTTGDVIAINYNEKVKHFIQIGLIVKALFWVILTGVVGFFQIYELRVMETKPDKAVSIIECDMNVRWQTTLECSVLVPTKAPRVSQVDFDAPLGYKEPERQPQHQEEPTVRTVPLHTNVCVNKLIQWICLQEGEDHSSYADMDTGFRVSVCSPSLSPKSRGTDEHYMSDPGFHRLWQSFGWQNKRNRAQPSSSRPKWHQKVSRFSAVQKQNSYKMNIWMQCFHQKLCYLLLTQHSRLIHCFLVWMI